MRPRAIALMLTLIAVLPGAAGLDAGLAPPAGPPDADGPCVGEDACIGLPLLVDENGDAMTGDLRLEAGLEFQDDAGLAYDAGGLRASPGPAFDGLPVCRAGVVAADCGDVDAVLAGSGLLGGGVNGEVSLAVDPAKAQRRVLGACAEGAAIRIVAADGTVACEMDDDTTYGPGRGLGMDGTTLRADLTSVQARAAAGCAPGSAVQRLAEDGTVTCETDDDTTYRAGEGLALTGSAFGADLGVVQARLAQACAEGSFARALAQDGSAVCDADRDTTYAAGTGLRLDDTSFAVRTEVIQARIAPCSAGSALRGVALDGGATCEADDDTTYTAGPGLLLAGTVFHVDDAAAQARVSGVCAPGNSIRSVALDGSVACEADDDTTYTAASPLGLSGTQFGLLDGACPAGGRWAWDGSADWTCGPDRDSGGDVTAVSAGFGLLGGAGSGDAVLAVDPDALQLRAGACAAGSRLRALGQDGSASCEADRDTTYTAGNGLRLDGTRFEADLAATQARVAGACLEQHALRVLHEDGSVICEDDSGFLITAVEPLVEQGGILAVNATGCAPGSRLERAGGGGGNEAMRCGVDSDSGGDITAVSTFNGITGGAASGAVTPSLLPAGPGLGGAASASCGYAAALDGLGSLSPGRWRCANSGAWRTPTVPRPASAALATGGIGAALTVGADGLALVAHQDAQGITLSRCTDVACTSFTSRDLSVRGWSPSVAVRPNGLPIVTFGNFDADPDDGVAEAGLYVADCHDPTCASRTTRKVAGTSFAPLTTVGISGDGLPLVLMVQIGSGARDVLSAFACLDQGCANTTRTVLDSYEFDFGRDITFSSVHVAVGTDGLPVIAYHADDLNDLPPSRLEVIKCGVVNCTAFTGPFTVSSGAAGVGIHNDIVVPADGRPVISFFDADTQHLKVFKCGNPSCSSGNAGVVLDTGSVTGKFTSIALAPDGRPYVTYRDDTSGDLKLLRCYDSDCNHPSNLIAKLDEDATFTSLAFGVDGLPIVAYHDNVSGGLKVLHLGNPFGLAAWSRRG